MNSTRIRARPGAGPLLFLAGAVSHQPRCGALGPGEEETVQTGGPPDRETAPRPIWEAGSAHLGMPRRVARQEHTRGRRQAAQWGGRSVAVAAVVRDDMRSPLGKIDGNSRI